MNSKGAVDYRTQLIKRIKHITDSGCWLIWKKNKYSSFSFKGQQPIAVHRASYIIFNGPIAKDLLACHKCNNKACINPSHIYAGTYKDNSRDCIEAGNHYQKSKEKCPKGHPYSTENTEFYLSKKETFRRCIACREIQSAKGNRAFVSNRSKIRKESRIRLGVKPWGGWVK